MVTLNSKLTASGSSATTSDATSYTAPWTSTVATTQTEINKRTYNVFDWLSDTDRANVRAGTMAADLTSKVQAAITYIAGNGGGTLFFPHGAYAFNVIQNSLGVNLVGESAQSQSSTANYFAPWDVTKPVLKWGDGTLNLNGGYIQNITLYAYGPNGRGQFGFVSDGGMYNFHCYNLSSRYFTDHCIKLTGGGTAASSYIQFFGTNVDGDATTGVGIGMYYGANFLTAISFIGIRMGMGANSNAIIADGVQFDMSYGWVQVADGNGIKFMNTNGHTPYLTTASLDLEVNPASGVCMETYNTSIALSDIVRGHLRISNSGKLKLSDTTTAVVGLTGTVQNNAEIRQPYIVGGSGSAAVYFTVTAAPRDTTCYMSRGGTGNNDWSFVNSTGGSGIIAAGATAKTIITAGAGQQFGVAEFTVSGTGANGFTFQAAATTGSPTILAKGSDSNISIKITPKGTGDVSITSGRLIMVGTTGNTLYYTNGVANGSVATTLGSVGPTGAATTVQGWLRVSINGTDHYIPYW